jgi:UDP-N-acetylglucosamine 2-epimerase
MSIEAQQSIGMVGRILVTFGTRPEAIKMMPVIQALRTTASLAVTTVLTGQHREMSAQVFDVFGEKPDIDLDLMSPGQTPASVTASVLTAMSEVLERDKPDLVVVHGDTTTAFAAATAAFYARCKIAHVEAGLRSFDLARPWPEEFNRVAVDSIADYLFAPTEAARRNLLGEYNRRGRIYVTGNTGIDALLTVAAKIDADPELAGRLSERHRLDPKRRLLLVTAHRRESFGEGFERICNGLARIAERDDIEIVYPVHPNPRVRSAVREWLGGHPNIRLIDPVDYVDMVFLMRRATIILTDSGGIQEEGPALGRPVLVMREVTERPEAVAAGAVKLVGTDPEVIREEADLLLDDDAVYRERARPVFPYGDGTAALEIAAILGKDFA